MSRPRFASLSRGSTQMNPWNGFFEIVRTTSTQGGTKSCTRFSLASDTGALGPAQVRLTIAPSDSRSPRGASVPRADRGHLIGRAGPPRSLRSRTPLAPAITSSRVSARSGWRRCEPEGSRGHSRGCRGHSDRGRDLGRASDLYVMHVQRYRTSTAYRFLRRVLLDHRAARDARDWYPARAVGWGDCAISPRLTRGSSPLASPGDPPAPHVRIRRRLWGSRTVQKRDPDLPFDAAARGQNSPVRSARPLLITVQLVLVFIIARGEPSLRRPGFGEGCLFPILQKILDMEDSPRCSSGCELR